MQKSGIVLMVIGLIGIFTGFILFFINGWMPSLAVVIFVLSGIVITQIGQVLSKNNKKSQTLDQASKHAEQSPASNQPSTSTIQSITNKTNKNDKTFQIAAQVALGMAASKTADKVASTIVDNVLASNQLENTTAMRNKTRLEKERAEKEERSECKKNLLRTERRRNGGGCMRCMEYSCSYRNKF